MASKVSFLLGTYSKVKKLVLLTLFIFSILLIITTGAYYYFSIHHRPQKFLQMDNFYLIHSPKTKCSEGRNDKNIISLVHSSRTNFVSREILRRTHGSVSSYQDWHFQLVFAVGLPPPGEEEMIRDLLAKEISTHGDILMGNFIDTYRNLTYKHVMGYKWAVESGCPPLQTFYLKSDDDVVVNVFHAVEFLSSLRGWTMNKDFYCVEYGGTQPLRNCSCKWDLSKEEYPEDFFPNYCGYATYLASLASIQKSLEASHKAPFLWIDDAFATGVLRKKVNEGLPKSQQSQIINSFVFHSDYENRSFEQVIGEKQCLGVIDEHRSPSLLCSAWEKILRVYGVFENYPSTCNALI